MRYLPTINLWAKGVQATIISGQLKILCGQWIQCGEGPKSRYISHKSNGYINAVHYPNTGREFITRARLERLSNDTTLTPKQYREAANRILGRA